MLRSLQIRDFVIVDQLALEFSAGFGALTGETGAGKSILLDALSLALGGRGEGGVVRAGCERAEISAEFDLPASREAAEWLAEQELDVADGALLLRRVIDAGGRSRAWINGSPVTLSQLRELGERLADIHGQHAHHALLRGETQRGLVDALGGCEGLADQVAEAHRAWRAAVDSLRRIERDAERIARDRDLLEFRVEELRALALAPGEWEELNLEQARLAHASSLQDGARQAHQELAECEPAVVQQLERLAGSLAGLAQYDAQLGEFAELLQSAAIQAGEAAHGLGRYCDRLDLDPQRLAELDRRIAQLNDAARKYRCAVEDLPGLLDAGERELAELCSAGDPERLAVETARLHDHYRQLAAELSVRREDAAKRLAAEVSAAMQTLAMGGGRFDVLLVPEPEGGAHGLEQVEFQVAAGSGQALRPLAKVASGGELSRIGLAIQVIASRDATTPTLIFDEVDVGIGGRVAEIVGQMLRRLGGERQVLCVTHLPQVAAQADWQWTVAKVERDGITLSTVRPLDESARVEEIARMLGGVEITRMTREHAREMIGQRS